MHLNGARVHVARGGYTGEDGFEVRPRIPCRLVARLTHTQISIAPEDTVPVAEALTALPRVQWTGLGARDSLRLEAGMCLYGHDLSEDVGPIEAGLAWVVGKDRRASGDFVGAEHVLRTLKDGPRTRRVGLVIQGAPAREGMHIFNKEGTEQLGALCCTLDQMSL